MYMYVYMHTYVYDYALLIVIPSSFLCVLTISIFTD